MKRISPRMRDTLIAGAGGALVLVALGKKGQAKTAALAAAGSAVLLYSYYQLRGDE